jgi:hypothetical protein
MKRVQKGFLVARLIAIRLLPIILFGWLSYQLATVIDKSNVEARPGESYINYTSFNVQNAREGEDVYFTVCRQHEKNYNYTGSLTVYVISVDNGKPSKVYARDIKGAVTNECENKVIRAKDFTHTPNTYEMSFCVDFKVQYEIPKTVCKTSNRYRIYAQPTDLADRIKTLQRQIEILEAQQADAVTYGSSTEPVSSLTAPQQTTPTQTSNAGSGSSSPSSSQSSGSQGSGQQPAGQPEQKSLIQTLLDGAVNLILGRR